MIWYLGGTEDSEAKELYGVANCWLCGWFGYVCLYPGNKLDCSVSIAGSDNKLNGEST